MESSTRPYRQGRWGLQILLDRVSSEFGTMDVWQTIPHRCHLGRLRRVGEEVEINGCNYIVDDVTLSGARCRAGKPVKIVETDDDGNEVVTIRRAQGMIIIAAYVHE